MTLSGFIDTYSGKLAAERAAKRVHGVRAVANDVEVRLRLERTDPDIAQDAARALELRSTIPDGVQVVVHTGHVTLTGKVDWLFQKQSAENAVRDIRGVRGVLNHISVVPRAAVRDVRHPVQLGWGLARARNWTVATRTPLWRCTRLSTSPADVSRTWHDGSEVTSRQARSPPTRGAGMLAARLFQGVGLDGSFFCAARAEEWRRSVVWRVLLGILRHERPRSAPSLRASATVTSMRRLRLGITRLGPRQAFRFTRDVCYSASKRNLKSLVESLRAQSRAVTIIASLIAPMAAFASPSRRSRLIESTALTGPHRRRRSKHRAAALARGQWHETARMAPTTMRQSSTTRFLLRPLHSAGE